MMPAALDSKLMCSQALTLIIGSLVGMELETDEPLSGNTLLSLVGSVFGLPSRTLGGPLDRFDHERGRGRGQHYPRRANPEATWTYTVYLVSWRMSVTGRWRAGMGKNISADKYLRRFPSVLS
jgi:hypothetical protein